MSIAHGTNALASSILLVCRPRSEDAAVTTRREFISTLRREFPEALTKLTQGSIAPVDLAQAAIGPGMAVYSRYSKVLKPDGSPMSVRAALQLINQNLDEHLAEREGHMDRDTRFCIAWYEQYAFGEGLYGEAETLCKAKNTSVKGLAEAGVLEARAGKVRLLKRSEYPEHWNPKTDQRLATWECAQHLVRVLESHGEEGAAEFLFHLSRKAEEMRNLAYRLFAIADRKGWNDEALAYNGLVSSWLSIQEKAARYQGPGTQGMLYGGGKKGEGPLNQWRYPGLKGRTPARGQSSQGCIHPAQVRQDSRWHSARLVVRSGCGPKNPDNRPMLSNRREKGTLLSCGLPIARVEHLKNPCRQAHIGVLQPITTVSAWWWP